MHENKASRETEGRQRQIPFHWGFYKCVGLGSMRML